MVIYTYRGKSADINERLKKDLDENVIPELKGNDADCVYCIDGNEGTGKSKLADNICGYVASQLNVSYSEENFCLSPTQFRNAILKAKKNDIVVYDEAHKGMGSRRSLSEINGILNDLMMEMRQKNLFVVLVLPTFFMLDKYPAIFRTSGLFHVYKAKNVKTGKRERGFWVFFNRKYKLNLYIKGKQYFNYSCIDWPKYTGRFYDQWIIDKKKYVVRKAEGFKLHGKRETKAEIYLEQRNKLIYSLYTELKIGIPSLTSLLKGYGIHLSQSGLQKCVLQAKMNLEVKNKSNKEELSEEDFEKEDKSE